MTMSENLHNIDDLFRSALEEKEETPSASVKESLLAHLDKKDAESYKKRFIIWKRAALLLLLLLAGFVLYESGIVRTGNGHTSPKNITKEPGTNLPGKKTINGQAIENTTINEPFNESQDINTKKVNTTDKSISDEAHELDLPIQKDNSDINTDPATAKKNPQDNNQAGQKNKQLARQIASIAGNKKIKTTADLSRHNGNYDKETGLTDENLPEEKRSIAPLANKIDLVKIDDRPFSSLQHPIAPKLNMSAAIDSLLRNNTINNINPKRIHHFKPYWTLTGLVTYDRVNYKLDSDLPSNITSIQHREVHEPSFSVSLLATRQVKEKWGLQTGLIYSNTAIGISPQKIYALQDPAGDIAYKYITSSGYAYIKPGFGSPPSFGDSLITAEAKHRLHSISVPVVIKYTVGKNRFLFIPGGGIEANFITRAKLETEIEDASNRETVVINKLNGAKSFYWSLVADAELRYSVNKKLSFNIRPVFRYAMSAITENNVVETFPYSFGAGLGLTWKF
jgi:hypothetical protein